jgi:hypothetical protein
MQSETAVHVFPSSCPKAVLDSDDLATQIWEHCQSVNWGNGKHVLAQLDIQAIIDEWLTARRGHQFEWSTGYPSAPKFVCKFCGEERPVAGASSSDSDTQSQSSHPEKLMD